MAYFLLDDNPVCTAPNWLQCCQSKPNMILRQCLHAWQIIISSVSTQNKSHEGITLKICFTLKCPQSHKTSNEAKPSLINDMISTVCPYPYGSCELVRKQQAFSHDPDDLTWLIKRCHTVRSQFADELNQDTLFQGWTIWWVSALMIDNQDKDNVVSAHEQQIEVRRSSHSYLITFSVFFLCLFSSVFWRLPLLLSIQPLLSTWGLYSDGFKRQSSRWVVAASPCTTSNLASVASV